MHPTKESNTVGIMLRDYNGKLGDMMKQALREGRRLFVVVRSKRPEPNAPASNTNEHGK